ncbi:acetate--CoA ligase family protein [Caenimonas sp. SL110]|uniref:acetate--CoA ligase family protein n=1 Tax=Caenimonas sp. SL110 TaxID=1450524 RepID=UPI00069CFDCB|nr:acetate--CoA ligase family protein [Caenimonas sp. SL110]
MNSPIAPLTTSSSPTTSGSAAIALLGSPISVPGYLDGLRHKALYLNLTIAIGAPLASWLPQLESALTQAFSEPPGAAPGRPSADGKSDEAYLVASIIYWVFQAHHACRLPVYEQGAFKPNTRVAHAYQLLIACADRAPGAAEIALTWVLEVFNQAAAGQEPAAIAHLPNILRRITRLVGLPGNSPPYLRAAWDLQVPLSVVELPIYQMGQGHRSRWIDSTLTDQTSQMAARLARNKMHTASILRRAGMPGPVHVLAADEAQALQAARKLGYPVVVKPADLDRGTAVAAGLQTEQEVKAAFAEAYKSSRNVLVEKHFQGRDYRVTVFNGRMIWAVERIPGGVTGDGQQTVGQLVRQLNADPRRGRSSHALMKILDMDEEADLLLQGQQLTVDAVPEAGRFVRLRRASNVAVGGTPHPVFDQVHPDNRDLAIRATAALRLDFGGVDFVIPDLAKSWLETGALICEVNSQPSIGITGTHLYPQIIGQLVQGNGRIPIAVIVGAQDPQGLATALSARLALEGIVTGWATRDRAMVGQEQVSTGALSSFHHGLALMSDQRVGALLLFLSSAAQLNTGLPFARFDVLVMADAQQPDPASAPADPQAQQLARLKASLTLACDGEVLQNVPAAGLVDAVFGAMIAADERHRT